MSGFSADWLNLRAAADQRARDPGLISQLATHLEPLGPVQILDLGSGTGANLHVLAPALMNPQKWRLCDHDPDLLAQVTPPQGVSVETCVVDLRTKLNRIFEPQPDLVTASAFFDLAGAQWVEELIGKTVAAGAAFYTALSYDGREEWSPPCDLDDRVLITFHADQHRDKGLGPALGPDATAALAAGFTKAGYHVQTAQSDWLLEHPRDSALISALAAGTAEATRPGLGADADEWRKSRQNSTAVRVGHIDLLAYPAKR